MTVHEITSNEDFTTTIHNNKTVLIDFYATWCGPCKMIAPLIEQHSNEEPYKDSIHFCKIDVEKLPSLCDDLDIQAMPTLVMFKNSGEKSEVVVDPNSKTLVEFLNRGL